MPERVRVVRGLQIGPVAFWLLCGCGTVAPDKRTSSVMKEILFGCLASRKAPGRSSVSNRYVVHGSRKVVVLPAPRTRIARYPMRPKIINIRDDNPVLAAHRSAMMKPM